MNAYFKLLSWKTKFKCIGVVFLAMISSILAAVWPVQLGELYTSISGSESNNVGNYFSSIMIFGLVYLSAECITILRRVILDCIIANHEAEMRENTIDKLLKMPVSYYGCGKLSGERTAQLNQGVAGLSQLIKICCNDIFATVLTAFCTLYQVTVNAPFQVTLIIVGYLCITILVSVLQIRSQNGIRENIIAQKNALDGYVCQSISNLELIRSMNAGEYEVKRLKPFMLRISDTEKKHHFYMGAYDCMKQLCKIVFQVALLMGSIVLVNSQKMDPGAVITVCLLFQQIIKPIDEVYRFMDETASSVIKAKVLSEIADVQIDPAFNVSSIEKAGISNEIVLKNTVIKDATDKEIAAYDGLRIPCDSVVAVIGDSGCGKTTLMRCLTRYFKCANGSTISLLGRDLWQYSQKELTDTFLYVPQKVGFFVGTIRDNLKYGLSRHISDEELIMSLREVCLYDSLVTVAREHGIANEDEINKYVLEYPIGEGGSGLSGGEGQRLSLARAFLRRPKVFVFDESTTGLDDGTVEKVLSNMEKHANSIGAGIIHISHDDRVVNHCHQIIKLDNKLKCKDVSEYKVAEPEKHRSYLAA